jgi:hypothetical protein
MLMLLVASFGLMACGGGGDEKPKVKVSTAVESDDPVVQWQTTVDRMNKGEIGAIWAQLPPSYQKDVNELVHYTVSKMSDEDKKVWDKGFGLVRKGIDVLTKQQALIADSPALKQINSKEGKENAVAIAALGQMLNLLVNSDISSTDKLGGIDMGQFLNGAMTEMARIAMETAENNPEAKKNLDEAKKMKVALKSRDGDDKATLEISGKGPTPELQKVVLVDGRWLPEDLAPAEWKKSLAEAKTNIDKSAAMTQESRKMVLDIMTKLDTNLDGIAAAKTQDELTAAVGEMMKGLPIPGLGGPTGPPPAM